MRIPPGIETFLLKKKQGAVGLKGAEGEPARMPMQIERGAYGDPGRSGPQVNPGKMFSLVFH